MNEDLVEPASAWLIGVLIPEMPLAENSRPIAGGFQHLGDGRRLEAHPFALEDCVRDTGSKFMPTGHQSTARRRTSWADVEVGETDTLFGEGVDVWGMDDRVAGPAEIAVSLV